MRRRGYGGREAPLLPQEVTREPAGRHDSRPAPILPDAVSDDVGLSTGVVMMQGVVGGAALPEVYFSYDDLHGR